MTELETEPDGDQIEPTLRVEARFRNARLYNAIVERAAPPTSKDGAGSASQTRGVVAGWCRLHGLNKNRVYALLNLQSVPAPYKIGKNYGILFPDPTCQRIANLLDRDIGYLFPPGLYQIKWPRLAVETEYERMIPLLQAPREFLELPPSQEEEQARRELRAELLKQLATLTPREEKVIRMRFGFGDFGLGDGWEIPLEEVGRRFGVSQTRIRQIQEKALRKLRHPSRSGALRPFLPGCTGLDDATAEDRDGEYGEPIDQSATLPTTDEAGRARSARRARTTQEYRSRNDTEWYEIHSVAITPDEVIGLVYCGEVASQPLWHRRYRQWREVGQARFWTEYEAAFLSRLLIPDCQGVTWLMRVTNNGSVVTRCPAS